MGPHAQGALRAPLSTKRESEAAPIKPPDRSLKRQSAATVPLKPPYTERYSPLRQFCPVGLKVNGVTAVAQGTALANAFRTPGSPRGYRGTIIVGPATVASL